MKQPLGLQEQNLPAFTSFFKTCALAWRTMRTGRGWFDPASRQIRRLFATRALTVAIGLGCLPQLWAADGDFAAPLLTITSHVNGQIVNTKTIVLSGTATDAGHGGNGISAVYGRGYVIGAKAEGSDTVNWSQNISLEPGANYLEVVAYDNSEQKNSTTLSLTINFQPLDSLAPTLTVTSHQNGQTVNTQTITVSGTATDAGRGDNGISAVYLYGNIEGATATGAGTATWSKAVTLNRGPNAIGIYVYDNSDVQNRQTVTLLINFQPVDGLEPTLNITSHTNGQVVTSSTIQISGTASDAGRGNNGISSVYLYGTLPNVNAAGADTVNWSKSVSLYPGANSIGVYAYDNSDVKNMATATITVVFKPADSLAPNLAITSHADGVTVFTSTITLSGTASDAGRGDNGIAFVSVQGRLPNSNTAGAGTVNWSKTIDLTPGRNYITVYADDNNQFPNEANQSITVVYQAADTLGPNLTVTSHTDGQTVNTKSITISGTASDGARGDNGISSVYCYGKIEGATATGAATVNWSQNVDLSPGRNLISVSAYDNSPFPNSTTVTLTITLQPLDSQPPSLIVTSHTDGQIVSTNVITVVGTASDAGRGDHGVSAVQVNFKRADGDTAVGSGIAHWSRTFALNPGRNSIYVSATDGSEFLEETNLTFNVTYQIGDVNPPVLTIDNPRNDQTFTTSTLTVSGTATDAGQGENGIAQVTVNGVAATGGTAAGSATATWSRTINLVPGANVISVVAADTKSNSAAQTVTVTYDPVDSAPPLITIDSHKRDQTVATSTILLAGTATDLGQGGSGVSSVTVQGAPANGGTAVGSATANWSASVTLTPGPNVISVVARDNSPARNDAAQSITIIYDPTDTAPPDLQVTSHRKGQTVSTPNIVLSGTATDAGFGDHGIADITVNSQPASGGTAAGGGVALWTRPVTLNLGPNLLSIVARDDSPNHNSAVFTITLIYEPVDHTAPDLVVTSHKDGQTVFSSAVTLEGTATDADRGDNGIASVTVNSVAAKGGTAVGPAKAAWSQPVTLNLGANTISIVAQDTLKNSVVKTITLIYDPHTPSAPDEFCWASNGGGIGTDAAYAIAVDAAGNSYITGSFEGSATFGTTNLTSQGLSDIFVAKYDPNGALLWARTAGGTNADAGFGIALDIQGNCYVTGYFSGKADVSGTSLSTTGSYDLFLAKYNPDGALVWASTTGQSSGLFGSALAVDPSGACYVTGSFAQQALFGNAAFDNNGSFDAFVAKFDNKGAVLWARQLGGDGTDQGTGIALDSNGNCNVTGFFVGDATFADLDLFSIGDQDMFICQFDPAGKIQWAQNAGALGKTEAAAIAVDRQGNSLVTGYFDSLAVFDSEVVSTDGFYDLFLAKYDAHGNVLWAHNTDSSAINGTALAADSDGNAYVTGSFVGPAVFGALTLTNTAVEEIFVAKYDAAGNFIWAKQAGGPAPCVGYGITVDSNGGCYLAGSISGLAGFGSKLLTANQNSDSVVAKLLGCGLDATTVSFTVSPASVPIDFTGVVALKVSGVARGSSVRIEKFLDENGDGQIQPQEPMLASFVVTDGLVPIIAGVTNWAVYFDTDLSNNGAMTVNLDFSQTTEIDRISGPYLFKLSDPAGVFAPIVQPFALTTSPLPQGITGIVTDAAGKPVGSAEVALLDLDAVQLVASVFNDASGRFTVYCQPGNYLLLPLRRGTLFTFGANFDALLAATAQVNAGEFLTKNVSLSLGSTPMAGVLKDAATGAAIPGVALYALSAAQTPDGGIGGLSFAFGLADGSGAFTIPAQDGNWALTPAPQQLARLGYLGLSDPLGLVITNGIATNSSIALPKSTALIYGQLKTLDGRPVAGAQLSAVDHDLGFQSMATTDSGGNYTLGVIAGNWTVEPSSTSLDGLGYQSPDAVTLLVEDGSATTQGFSVAPVDLSISVLSSFLPNTPLQFQITGESGRDCQVQVSSDLKNWSNQSSFRLSHNPHVYRDEGPKAGVRFYRVQR